MISKSVLVSEGFERVQGSSVWHCVDTDTYVAYIDGVTKGKSVVLDGRTESDSAIKAKPVKVEEVKSVKKEKAKVVEPKVEEVVVPVENPKLEETVVTQPVD